MVGSRGGKVVLRGHEAGRPERSEGAWRPFPRGGCGYLDGLTKRYLLRGEIALEIGCQCDDAVDARAPEVQRQAGCFSRAPDELNCVCLRRNAWSSVCFQDCPTLLAIPDIQVLLSVACWSRY